MTDKIPSLAFVIPAYNEKECIEEVVTRSVTTLERLAERWELWMVDDRSDDGTAEILDRLAEGDERIKVVHNPERIGCHPSELVALRQVGCEWMLFLPSDLQIVPEEAEKYVAAIADDADIIVGWRKNRADSFFRNTIGYCYRIARRIFLGMKIRDIDSATMYRKTVIDSIGDRIELEPYFIPTNLMMHALAEGFHAKEIIIEHYPRTTGASRMINLSFLFKTPFQFLRFLKHCRELKKELREVKARKIQEKKIGAA